MRKRLADVEHLLRVAGLFLAGAVVFVVARALFVPADFGVYGHYRAGALADNAARPLKHAGRAACAACHDQPAAAIKGGKHASIGCETCHGPAAAHAAEPASGKPPRPEGRSLCLLCHTANVARPGTFPQIDVQDHAAEGLCTECHTPHSPGM